MIAGAVEPGQIVEGLHLDHQRVAVPLAVRPTHPTVHRGLGVPGHVDRAIATGVLVNEKDVVLALDDLKRVRHIGRSREPRHVAFRFRIRLGPSGPVLFPLLQALRRVRDRAVVVDNHALSRRNREKGAELPERGRRGGVTFEIPVGAVDGLPDAIQVRVAGDSSRSRAWRRSALLPPTAHSPRRGGPGLCRYRQRCGNSQHERDECVPEAVTHVRSLLSASSASSAVVFYRFSANAMYWPGVALDPPRPPPGTGPSKRAENIPG